MNCSKHGTEMKWIGSLSKGSMVCEACEMQSEPSSPGIDSSAPVTLHNRISWADFLQNYGPASYPQFGQIYSAPTTLYMQTLGWDKTENHRKHAGYYYLMLANHNGLIDFICPYCAAKDRWKCATGCITNYFHDLKSGLVDDPI
jgi:hypothetical protein